MKMIDERFVEAFTSGHGLRDEIFFSIIRLDLKSRILFKLRLQTIGAKKRASSEEISPGSSRIRAHSNERQSPFNLNLRVGTFGAPFYGIG